MPMKAIFSSERLKTFGEALVDKEKMKHLLDTGSRKRTSNPAQQLLESAKQGPLTVQDCEGLLDMRAEIDAQDSLGVSALMCLAFAGCADSVRVLLERGAAPEPANCDGWTALHYAAKGNQRECARLVLEGGVDPLAKNNAGQTAHDLVSGEAKSWSKGCEDSQAWDALLFDAEADARRKSGNIVVGAHVKVTSAFLASTEEHGTQVLERGLEGTIIKLDGKSVIIQFKSHATTHIVSSGKFRNLDVAVEESTLDVILHIGDPAANGLAAIECKNVGGESLAMCRVDSTKSVSDFRRHVQEELTHISALNAGQSAVLTLPSGYVFPKESDDNSLSVALIMAKAYSGAPQVLGECCQPGCSQPAKDGLEGFCSTKCRDVPKFDKKCLFKTVGIFHKERSGTFQADSKLVGWRGDDGSTVAYPWTSVRKAEWVAGKLKIEVGLGDGTLLVADFEVFPDEDYDKINPHFESKGVGRISVDRERLRHA